MLRALRKHVTPATALAFVALVFAVTGGAFAASGASVSSTRGGLTASTVKKKKPALTGKPGPRGPRGPAGPAGPAGTAGPAGPAGAKGDNGAAGANGGTGNEGPQGKEGTPGTNGTNGKNGKTVVVGEEAKGGPNCAGEGGSSFEVEGSGTKHYACNGSPWTPNNTLPPKATETGTWSMTGLSAVGGSVYVPISFSIPLGGGFRGAREIKLHFVEFEEEAPAGCTGGTFQAPTAEPGNLCIYSAQESSETKATVALAGPGEPEMLDPGATGGAEEGPHVGVTGGALIVSPLEAEAKWIGTWAVTEKEA